MKRTEFIKEISRRTNYTQYAIKEVFDVARDILIEELAKGNEISFINGITFLVRQREKATRFNYLLKKEVTISEKILPKVKFADSFKDAINK